MYLLGISGGVLAGNQDAAAALLHDWEVVAAVEEERLSKVKHANGSLPGRAIRHCLRTAGIELSDVHAIGSPGATYRDFEQTLASYLQLHFGHVPALRLFDHHTAHAYSTFAYSPFSDALVLTADFSGDGVCTTLSEAHGLVIERAWSLSRPDSLGLFYAMITQYLGFGKDDEEHKVMGLAALGQPRYDFSDVLALRNGSYTLNPAYVRGVRNPDRPAPSKQEPLFHGLPLPAPPRIPGAELTSYHQDVAASAQQALERVVLHLLEREVVARGIRTLCLAGGVALNCVLNRRIRESGLFEQVFVPPHASDAGLALGSAAMLSIEETGLRPRPMASCRWGPSYDDDEVTRVLESCGVPFERVADVTEVVAQELANGKIVGWFQGGLEFGPRALGGRSILADPRRPEMQERVNRDVKLRETFRPFAPSCLEERAAEWFVGAVPTPYMTMTFEVVEGRRSSVPAITHVDGSARLHTVSREHDPLFHVLLENFERLTGVPMLMNTSLNLRGQPIVAEPRDAVSLFYGSGLHVMAIGNTILRKSAR